MKKTARDDQHEAQANFVLDATEQHVRRTDGALPPPVRVETAVARLLILWLPKPLTLAGRVRVLDAVARLRGPGVHEITFSLTEP